MNEDIQEVIRQYDALGDGEFTRFEREGVRGKLTYQTELAELVEHTAPGETVLDAGGGAGKFAIPLAERGRNVSLLDISGEQCRIAAEKVTSSGPDSRLDVTRGDIRSTGFESTTFDSIICVGGALSHVLGDVEQALAEFARVAKDGATLVVSVMNRSMSHKDLPHALQAEEGELPERLVELARKKRQQRDEYEDTIGPFYKYSTEEMRSTLERHGFEVTRTMAIDRHPIFLEPLLETAWDDAEVRQALASYERTVSALPWFQDTGNMTLLVSRLERRPFIPTTSRA